MTPPLPNTAGHCLIQQVVLDIVSSCSLTRGDVLQHCSAIGGHTLDLVTVLALSLTPSRNTGSIFVLAVYNLIACNV